MIRFLTVVLVLLIAMPASAATVNQGTRVVLMGDSEAFLLSWEFPRLARATGARITSVVAPGSSVISWSRELGKEWSRVRRAKPEVLLVSLGANDACTGPMVVANENREIGNHPPFFRTLRAKLDRTKAKCIVWLGPPAIGAQNPTRRQCSKALAEPGLDLFAQMIQSAGIPYLDARTVQVQLWDDHLHCSRPMHDKDPSDGCKTWAEWVWRRLTTEDLCTGRPADAGL